MSILKMLPIFTWAIVSCCCAEAQNRGRGAVKKYGLSPVEIKTIQYRIYDYLEHNSPLIDSAESEVVMIVLETDSTSRIADIHLLADEKNKGNTYLLLCKMTTDIYRDWKPENFPHKTIVVPLYTSGWKAKNNNNYADFVFWEMSWAGDTGVVIKEDKRSILISGIYYPGRTYSPHLDVIQPETTSVYIREKKIDFKNQE